MASQASDQFAHTLRDVEGFHYTGSIDQPSLQVAVMMARSASFRVLPAKDAATASG
jgi:hypothetical protein